MLLKELRAALDERFPNNYKEISMAVHVEPFSATDGTPMKDVSAFVPFFDRINLMTYGKNWKFDSVTLSLTFSRTNRYQRCVGF